MLEQVYTWGFRFLVHYKTILKTTVTRSLPTPLRAEAVVFPGCLDRQPSAQLPCPSQEYLGSALVAIETTLPPFSLCFLIHGIIHCCHGDGMTTYLIGTSNKMAGRKSKLMGPNLNAD